MCDKYATISKDSFFGLPCTIIRRRSRLVHSRWFQGLGIQSGEPEKTANSKQQKDAEFLDKMLGTLDAGVDDQLRPVFISAAELMVVESGLRGLLAKELAIKLDLMEHEAEGILEHLWRRRQIRRQANNRRGCVYVGKYARLLPMPSDRLQF